MGITHSGEESEELFERLVYRAIKTTRSSEGDKRVMLDDNRVRHVEVKMCSSRSGGSANQVRAIKYHTLVIFTPNRDPRWIVIPPNVVVQRVAERERGQHTEIPFECCTLSLGPWTEPYSCSDDELEQKVVEAILEGERHKTLRKSMSTLLIMIRKMGFEARREVQEIIATGEEPPYWKQ